jgi:hypothetical protein
MPAASQPRREELPIKGGKGGKPKWKAQSEQFRAAMRAMGGSDRGGGGGGAKGGRGASSYEPAD